MSTTIKQLILLSNHRTHARALGLCIPPKLKINLTRLDLKQLPEQLEYQRDTLILIDLTNLSAETQSLLQNQLRFGTAALALFSANTPIDIEELVQWPNVCGLFNLDDSFDVICKGVKAVMCGENWFTPHISAQLDDYHSEHQASLSQKDSQPRTPYLESVRCC